MSTRMIGTLDERTWVAGRLGFGLTACDLARDDDAYGDARGDADAAIAALAIDVGLPDTKAGYVAQQQDLLVAVLRSLMECRGRLGGDVIALPLFLIAAAAPVAVAECALGGEVGDSTRGQIEIALDDLGLERDLMDALARAGAGAETWIDQHGVERVRERDVFRGGLDFLALVLRRVWEEVSDQRGAHEKLSELRAEIAAFRREVRADNDELARLIAGSQANVRALVDDLRQRLVAAGSTDENAQELVGDPVGLWARIRRWSGGAGARDAAEAALWAALDYVPGGRGAALGVEIAHAVRDATKDDR